MMVAWFRAGTHQNIISALFPNAVSQSQGQLAIAM